MKFYHGSQVANITMLQPSISNHGEAWVYLTTKRENTIVYLSNAIERFHNEHRIGYKGKFYKWASYGFNKEGMLVLEEYYPNAIQETYQGIGGYIYCAEYVEDYKLQKDIPFAAITHKPVKVASVEYIDDAYEELLRLETEGMIQIKRYEAHSPQKIEWIEKVITETFHNHQDHIDYITFLKAKFEFLKDR